MQISLDAVRNRYRQMTDGEIAQVNPEDLSEEARQIHQRELERRFGPQIEQRLSSERSAIHARELERKRAKSQGFDRATIVSADFVTWLFRTADYFTCTGCKCHVPILEYGFRAVSCDRCGAAFDQSVLRLTVRGRRLRLYIGLTIVGFVMGLLGSFLAVASGMLLLSPLARPGSHTLDFLAPYLILTGAAVAAGLLVQRHKRRWAEADRQLGMT